MKVKKLGFLLFGGPQSEDSVTVAGLAESAIRRGLEVEIFIMYEAVLNSVNKRYLELADQGVKVTVCGHNRDEYGATRTEKFNYASQYENAKLISGVDKYIAFT